MIERFGGFSSHNVLAEHVINSPSNAFMSTADPHHEFDALNLWFTPAGVHWSVPSNPVALY